jgi:hypothetical protein
MARLLLFVGLAAGLFILFHWLSRQPSRVYWQLIIVLLSVVMLVLVLSGRANWLLALIAVLLPFVRGWLSRKGAASSQAGPVGGQTSRVQSRYLRMTLNHDSGEIGGEVLAGQFAGKSLDQLDLDDLLKLLRECRDDDESVAMLQAYLDREHTDWQQHAGAEGQQQSTAVPGEMSRDEALQVLGLPADAGEADIIEAHRRLMQKLHPDRGGSAYLAATINLAKQTLLGR